MFHLLVHRGRVTGFRCTQWGLSLTCGTVCPGLSVSDSEDDKAPAEALNKSTEGSPVNFSCCFGLVLVFEIRVLES